MNLPDLRDLYFTVEAAEVKNQELHLRSFYLDTTNGTVCEGNTAEPDPRLRQPHRANKAARKGGFVCGRAGRPSAPSYGSGTYGPGAVGGVF
jgi:hypothetical protein